MSRKTSVSGEKEDKDKTAKSQCLVCNKAVLKKDKGIECEICLNWVHAGCANMSDEVYTFLKENKNAHWYCEGCNRGVAPVLEQLVGLHARQDKMEQDLSTVKQDVVNIKKELHETGVKLETAIEAKLLEVVEDRLESTVGDRVNKMKQSLDDGMVAFEKKVSSAVETTVKELQNDVSESIQIERRKRNIVIHGVQESDNTSDKDLVYEILSKGLKLDPLRYVEEIQRIGQRKEKVRPIRLKVISLEGKNEILRRAKMLKNEGFEKVFLQPDLTVKQQGVDKKLRDELKRLRSTGETDIKIKSGKIIKNESGGQVKILYQISSA